MGLVELRDQRSLSTEMIFRGGEVLADLDISGNTLITSGYTRSSFM